MSTHIIVVHVDELSSEPAEQFAEGIAHHGLDVQRIARPAPGPYAGMQWLLPTAVVLFFGKSYFDGFLKEAGKDHYNLLKKATAKLTKEYIGPAAKKVLVVFSKGKIQSGDPEYSLTYSVVGELDERVTAKLLLEPQLSNDESAAAVAAFLDFLKSFHDGALDADSISGLKEAPMMGGKLLVHFNQESQRLEVIAPIPEHVRNGLPT
ncbi:hypothetical protein DyAD56_16340 [Dyella sp. AD56]|uniref:hypothetical protein n=1 Tax=Dyella sp. AD56 TaxID=1528744 RepID=UPI000C86639B|nr:hypothetical protein [Dyella sp. AD56]PMQ04258.1 hypothetical protein DyAD56_16340 [Dyella sp. AD56]